MKTLTRNVALDRNIDAELVIAAAEAERSVSYIVRQAVRAWLDDRRAHAARPHKREERPA
jgi:predicted transcriptional regulator